MRLIFFIVLAFMSQISCDSSKEIIQKPEVIIPPVTKEPLAKNVIFLVGDGMGLTQISAGMYASGNYTSLERFKNIGLHKSQSSDNLITDSAAGATAFSCGIKTYNGAIGVNDKKEPVNTILEEAVKRNLATGLVATSTIVHATPASFFAHNESRQNYEAIATELVNSQVNYFVGGGKKYFDNREKDERNLIAELEAKSYDMSDFIKEDFSAAILPSTGNFGYFTSNADPLMVSQGREYLLDASLAGLDFLKTKSKNGFFMMIEGSQIDWGGHANDGDYVISEFKEFDEVIKEVLTWAEKDGETLVVVTGDHETGGLAIQPKSTQEELILEFTTTYHTAAMIPVFAKGPGAHLFQGIYENTSIYDKMRAAFGWN